MHHAAIDWCWVWWITKILGSLNDSMEFFSFEQCWQRLALDSNNALDYSMWCSNRLNSSTSMDQPMNTWNFFSNLQIQVSNLFPNIPIIVFQISPLNNLLYIQYIYKARLVLSKDVQMVRPKNCSEIWTHICSTGGWSTTTWWPKGWSWLFGAGSYFWLLIEEIPIIPPP